MRLQLGVPLPLGSPQPHPTPAVAASAEGFAKDRDPLAHLEDQGDLAKAAESVPRDRRLPTCWQWEGTAFTRKAAAKEAADTHR